VVRPATPLWTSLAQIALRFPCADKPWLDPHRKSLRRGSPAGSHQGSAQSLGYSSEVHYVIPELARHSGLGLRQFEQRFANDLGISPKLYAQVRSRNSEKDDFFLRQLDDNRA
jgi:hypothetical protein